MNMNKFFSWHFWFNMQPGHLFSIYEYVLIGTIILLLMSAATFFLKKKNLKRKKNQFLPAWRQLYYFSTTNAAIGILLWIFQYQIIPFFSSRFWYPIWGLEMFIWLAIIIKIFKNLPRQIKAREKKDQYNKYLP